MNFILYILTMEEAEANACGLYAVVSLVGYE